MALPRLVPQGASLAALWLPDAAPVSLSPALLYGLYSALESLILNVSTSPARLTRPVDRL
jgi:hypothetical protein